MNRLLMLIAPAALAVVCVVVYLAIPIDADEAAPSEDVLIEWGALHSQSVAAGQWWRLGSYALLHRDVSHLGLNMCALLAFGVSLAMFQGQVRTAAALVFGVVAGGAASLYWNPGVLSVGISGGLFGLAGAMAALLIRFHRHIPKRTRGNLIGWLLTIVGYNVVLAFMPGMQLDHAAHIGGAVGGLAVGLALARRPDMPGEPAPIALAAAVAIGIVILGGAALAIGRIPDEPARPQPPDSPRAKALAAVRQLEEAMVRDAELLEEAKVIYNKAIRTNSGYTQAARRIRAESMLPLQRAVEADLLATIDAVAAGQGVSVLAAARRLRGTKANFCKGLGVILGAEAANSRHDVQLPALELQISLAKTFFETTMQQARQAITAAPATNTSE